MFSSAIGAYANYQITFYREVLCTTVLSNKRLKALSKNAPAFGAGLPSGLCNESVKRLSLCEPPLSAEHI